MVYSLSKVSMYFSIYNIQIINFIDMSMQIFCPKAGGDAIISTDIINN